MNQNGLKVLNNHVAHHIDRAVGRIAVRIENYSLVIREILGKSCLNRANHVTDGPCVVAGRNTYENFGRFNFFGDIADRLRGN